MGQRSSSVTIMDVQIELSMEECVEGMVQQSKLVTQRMYQSSLGRGDLYQTWGKEIIAIKDLSIITSMEEELV